jgi:hypothetical protein
MMDLLIILAVLVGYFLGITSRHGIYISCDIDKSTMKDASMNKREAAEDYEVLQSLN